MSQDDDQNRYRTLDPATAEVLESFDSATEVEIESALTSAEKAFSDWHRRPIGERLAVLEAAAAALEDDADSLAEMMATEMGKPLAQGRSEAEKCAWVCRYYCEHAEEYLQPREESSDGSEAWVRFDPLGPILAIMPWNFPFWQVFRCAAPALAAGNVVILKHATSSPRCAAEIERIFRQAGAPQGVFQNLYVSREQVADMIDDERIRGIALTGSTGAGSKVAELGGGALKPMVMELGGSDPFMVFDDADLDEAVKQAVTSRSLCNGQSCIAAKRFLVQDNIYDRFLERFVPAMTSQVVGDPRREESEIGPLAREDLRDQLGEQVEQAKKDGAKVLGTGDVPEGPGFYYPPTVLAELDPNLDIAKEELFGPVAVVYRFNDEDEAIEIANGTPFGLGASLWTQNKERWQRLVPRIRSGNVFVNGLVKSDPRLPFGGVGQSGFGRELGSDGIREFVNRKTVWVG